MPPNIVYLHSHDTGRYVQPYGHQIPTPNIQRLADQGLLFRQAFCAAPIVLGQPRVPADRPVGARQRHDRASRTAAGRSHDYGRHIVHPLREAGYWSALIGEQHLSARPRTSSATTTSSTSARRGSTRSRRRRCSCCAAGRRSRSSCRSGSSRPTASSSSPARCATRSTARRRRTCPTRPRRAPTWPRSRPARARSTRASARSCTALDEQGLADDTLVVLTTDHGLPFPGAKAHADRPRPRRDADHPRARAASTAATSPTRSSRRSTSTRRCASSRARRCPTSLHGALAAAARARGRSTEVRDELFAELTYHAAYDPQRAIRTRRHKLIRHFGDRLEPVLPNVDDSPSKDAARRGRLGRAPAAARRALRPAHGPGRDAQPRRRRPRTPTPSADLDGRLEAWMRDTDDPLLDGPVLPPPGATVNDPAGLSATEPFLERRGLSRRRAAGCPTSDPPPKQRSTIRPGAPMSGIATGGRSPDGACFRT